MSTARYIDGNGYLLIQGCPVSSFGVFDYSAAQVGEENGDPMRIVKVYRPESAVKDPELINSLKTVPIIDDHDYLNGDPDAAEDAGMAPEEKGIDGVITENLFYESPWLKADLKIFSRRLQQAIKKGKRDLSLGYVAKFTHAPGVFNGEPYEYVQTEMRGNHIALVDEARVSGARVLDGLVFDSMRFDITPSKHAKDNIMDPEDIKETGDNQGLAELLPALQELLPKLQAAVAAEAGADPNAADPNAADPAAAPAADPNAATATKPEDNTDPNAAPAEPAAAAAAPAAGEGFDLGAACAMLEELLPKLKAKAGEAAPAAPATGDNHELSVDNNDPNKKPEGDGIQGIAEPGTASDPKLNVDNKDGEVGSKASPGPSAGKHENGPVGDAAMKNLYADIAQREKLYSQLSPVVGVFDHSMMTANEVAAYGVQKLKLPAVKGQERVALDSYFAGRKAVESTATAQAAPQFSVKAGDSAGTTSPEMSAYLNGSK